MIVTNTPPTTKGGGSIKMLSQRYACKQCWDARGSVVVINSLRSDFQANPNEELSCELEVCFKSSQIWVCKICTLLVDDMTWQSMLSCLAKCTSDNVPAYPGQDAKIDKHLQPAPESLARCHPRCDSRSFHGLKMDVAGSSFKRSKRFHWELNLDISLCLTKARTIYKYCCWF